MDAVLPLTPATELSITSITETTEPKSQPSKSFGSGFGSSKYFDWRKRYGKVNGPQFISRDFKEFIRIAGMTHVKTSPYYPHSNGKIARYHRTIKGDCIRAKSMTSVDDARQAVTQYVHHHNTIRLHSAIGYVTPHTKLAGKEKELFAQRVEKLEATREGRRLRRAEAIQNAR
jgi:putative transposase